MGKTNPTSPQINQVLLSRYCLWKAISSCLGSNIRGRAARKPGSGRPELLPNSRLKDYVTLAHPHFMPQFPHGSIPDDNNHLTGLM